MQVYYHNKVTGASSWVKPAGFEGEVAVAPVPIAANKVKGTDWSEVTCSDSRKYYYNPQSQVRSLPRTAQWHLKCLPTCQ